MTDARFPERWLNDKRIRRLSADGFRLFVLANAWSVSNRTDGRLEAVDLADLGSPNAATVAELVTAGLWRKHGGGWQIVDFDVVQTTRAQLAGLQHKRADDRERQARHRAHKHGDHSHCLPEYCSERVTPVTRDTKARPGQARRLEGGP